MNRRMILRVLPVAAAVVAAMGLASAARGQAGGGPSGDAAAAPSGEGVEIRLESFGVGGVCRPGDMAGVRVAIRASGEGQREVAMRLHLPDGDGDTTLYTRYVVLNPGREEGVWLYGRLPWAMAPGSVARVSIAESSHGDDGSPTVGRQLDWKPVTATRVMAAQESLAYVIGTSSAGLDQYSAVQRDRDTPAAGQERLNVVAGLSVESLPDHWAGLASAEIVLWTEGDPSGIRGDATAAAIREWVHRGGHLVIVIPGIGSAWTSATNPLADLLPRCRIDRLADADLSMYRELLGGGGAGAVERGAVRGPLHRFVAPPDAEQADATPIITGPHGVIAMRRLVGTGMVTVIGLDVVQRRLASTGWLRADAFWSRITGRRAGTPTTAEIEAAGASLVRAAPHVWIDERIGVLISRSRVAGAGMLGAIVLFGLYLMTAGPVSWLVLKQRGLERHAWMVFVCVAGVFAMIAWSAAQWLRPKREEARHFTLVDHVYGQPVQRARSFVSVLLPTYGEQRVSVGEAGTDERWVQSLTPWSDPASDGAPTFPDSRSYAADARRLTDLVVPTRQTVRTFQADWLGGPRWSMPVPESDEHSPRVDASGRLSGRLRHGLPGALEHVHLILVRGQAVAGALGRPTVLSPPLVSRAYDWVLAEAWLPGQVLDLGAFQPSPGAQATKRLAEVIPRLAMLSQTLPVSVKDEDLDDMMGLYSVLEPPELGKGSTGLTNVPGNVRRRLVHGLDLSKWFTQPCLIIIGRVAEGPSPVPMSVDGRALDGRASPSMGRTIVRWVYPLSPSPHAVEGATAPAPGDAS